MSRLGRTIALAVLLAAGAGCSAAKQPAGHPEVPRSFTANQTSIVGARPAERLALRTILAELAPTEIVSIHIARNTDRGWKLPPDALTLTIASPDDLRANWEARMLAGRYLAAIGHRELRAISIVSTRSSSGRAQDAGFQTAGRAGTVAPIRRILATSDAPRIELRNAAGGIDLTVQTGDPAAFLKDHFQAVLDAILRLRPNAFLFGVEDGSGEIVYGLAHAANWGEFYTRPDLRSCGPLVSLGPPIPAPLCPV